MIVYDSSDEKYVLRETQFGGGEGKLYAIENDDTIYAKIFNIEKRTKGRREKIIEWEEMLSQKVIDESFFGQIVVPQKCLYESTLQKNANTFVGYTMQKQMHFRTLKNVYVENDINYIQKVWIARNLCILTNRVHSFEREVVIGDYNADNVIVFLSTSTAKFIDVDSFQLIIDRGGLRILCPCTVGIPEFMAPEISRRLKKEKANLETVSKSANNPVFTKNTDLYAMAYHIFALLMNGSSPYASMPNMEELAKHASKTVSSVDVNRLHAAENGDFVFAKRSLFKKPPAYAPKYQILTKELQKLFERAFIEGASDPKARPNADEFYRALGDYFDMLEKRPCGHFMPSYYSESCEWCRLKKLGHYQ